MQSVSAVIADPYVRRVVDARAAVCDEPAIGQIYDPPFAHFTIQLAEDYDWAGLQEALARSSRRGWCRSSSARSACCCSRTAG